MKKLNQSHLLLLFFIYTAMSSCVSHGEIINFTEGPPFPDSLIGQKIQPVPAMRIQVDDLLSIKVRTQNQEVAAPYNLDGETTNLASSGGMRPIIGFLVDTDGNIDFPVIGKVQAAGFTVSELKEQLITKLRPYLNDPVIIIRFVNFRITLSGEVSTPGSYIMPNERVTILDAIGQAGDLTPYANRRNILIIRQQDGIVTSGHINLQSRDLFDSPFFFLRQNDYIYVEPLSEKTASIRDQSQRILPWVSVGTALITLTLTLANLR